jgi:hypothetical protein
MVQLGTHIVWGDEAKPSVQWLAALLYEAAPRHASGQGADEAASRRLGLSPICNNALQILAGRHRLALACTQFAVTI